MTITLHATGIELTDALKQYAEEKMAGLEKFFNNIQSIDIDIGVRNHHHQKGKIFYAECNVAVPGKLIRVEKDAADLYKAIDKVKDHLKVELQDAKGKLKVRDRNKLRESREYQG